MQQTGDFRIEVRDDGEYWGVASFYGETIYVHLDDNKINDLNSITRLILKGHFKLTNETRAVLGKLKKESIYCDVDIEKYQYHLNKLRLLGMAKFEIETNEDGDSCTVWTAASRR